MLLYFDNDKYTFNKKTKRVPCSPACVYIRLQINISKNTNKCSPACVYIRLQINISKNTNKCRSFLITLGISVKDSASMIAF